MKAVAALLCISAFIYFEFSIFWFGRTITRKGEYSGKTHVGFRKYQKYKISGKHAALMGRSYKVGALFIISSQLLAVIAALFSANSDILDCLGLGFCSGFFIILAGNLIASFGATYEKEDASQA